jgi:general secretion pathway protein N
MALPRPSRRGLLLALACSVAALLAALSALPARWLLLAAPPDGIVSLADASGTVWNGSAWIALGPPGARRVLPQALQWQWHWRTLEMELRHPWLQGPLRLSPGWTGATLSAQSLRAPAAALSALGSPWNTLAPQGTLELKWQTLPLGGRLPAGPLAELRWRDAATALAPVNPVGSYVLRLQGDGKSGGALALSTESGLLDVSGQGSLSPRGATFQGRATYAAKADVAERAALDGLLSALGRRSEDVVTFGTGG